MPKKSQFDEELREKYPFFTDLNDFETECIACGCICHSAHRRV